jgi:hypothetical protein
MSQTIAKKIGILPRKELRLALESAKCRTMYKAGAITPEI